jgi:hypothetical protein
MKMNDNLKASIRHAFERERDGETFFVGDVDENDFDRVLKLLDRLGYFVSNSSVTRSFPELQRVTFDIEIKGE